MATSVKSSAEILDLPTKKALEAAVADAALARAQVAALVADVAALRAAIVGMNAKLDADVGVTDINYAALWNPAAQTSTAISTVYLS